MRQIPNSTECLTIAQPDDWHVHLRDGAAMRSVLAHTAQTFARAIVMPNLRPPVTTVSMALEYRQRILAALPPSSDFTPLMTLYLTDSTRPEEILKAKETGVIVAAKYYPAGATTHSEAGVTDARRIYPVLQAMQSAGLLLLVHGEVSDPRVDVFDREKAFIDKHLVPMLHDFPEMRVIMEHVTTRDAVDFVSAASDNVGATITAHHLLMNRNALFAGGMRPHHYCLPVLKREEHRLALVAAATSGHPRFFLGTDSAPHSRAAKESACGCAGIYTAHAALELYSEAFEEAGALHRLEAFASFHGADFYRLPRNQGQIRLAKRTWTVPQEYPLGDGQLVPMWAGERITWQRVP